MHEKEKLAEAKYFYQRMLEEKSNIEHFKHNLSALLSSARSILQYALKESSTKQGGQAWYDNHMASNPVFAFFKDKRDVNIHFEPVRPKVQHNVTISETIHVSDSIDIVIKDKSGNIKGEYHSPDVLNNTSGKEESSVVSETIYKFDDWAGIEDVISLSRQYLNELENFVNEGIVQNFISG